VWAVRRELFGLCRRLRPRIVHTRGMSGLDALLPSRLAGTPSRVHGEHGWDVHDLHGSSSKQVWLRRLHSPLVDRYITVSKHLERYLVERVGIRPSRITQIHNGVDTERFSPAARAERSALPAGFADVDSIVIGTVGRLQAVKDQATLIRAFARLARQPEGARLRLVIVGGGPLARQLQALVAELGIERQTWLAGPLTDVRHVLGCLDVFVLSSLQEGISNTILEAMATGLPVVATAVGGNLELVIDRRTGRFFEPGDVAKLAGVIREYAGDAPQRREHARLARQRAEQVFGLPVMVESYQRVYEELCSAG